MAPHATRSAPTANASRTKPEKRSSRTVHAKKTSTGTKAQIIEARKIRNRESAERSRKRRLQHTAALETQVAKLSAENAYLLAELAKYRGAHSFENVSAQIAQSDFGDDSDVSGVFDVNPNSFSDRSSKGVRSTSSSSAAALAVDPDLRIFAQPATHSAPTSNSASTPPTSRRYVPSDHLESSLIVDSPFLFESAELLPPMRLARKSTLLS